MKTTTTTKTNDNVLTILAQPRTAAQPTSATIVERAGDAILSVAGSTIGFAGQLASVTSGNHFAIGKTAGALFNTFDEQRKVEALARRYNLTPTALAAHIAGA